MLKFVCILLVAVNMAAAVCYKKNPDALKVYTINLDLPPQDRFTETVKDFKDGIVALVNFQKAAMDPTVVKLLEIIGSDVDNYLPYPFNEEMKGIANATGIDLGDIVAFNLIYDATAFCTGIIAQTPSGKLLHGRNLDYSYQKFMTNITYIARFEKNGQLVYTSIHIAGFLGILTGHKHNSFTFQINERDQGSWIINFLFALLDKQATPLAFLSRRAMENATDFNSAVKILSTTDMIAPCYFIVAGINPYEGVVITRNQDQVVDYWRLNATSNGIEKWFLLETNYDHWVPPPSSDPRSIVGIAAMNATGQANINPNTLVNVLTVDPVCNNSTVYSVYMSAVDDDSDIQIFVRYN